jgi:2-polyprenyl-3-methyl-5-hydroxy-6-metoxy-1,4-benzoquinol methylase
MENSEAKSNSVAAVKSLECPICGGSMALSGQADYYDRIGPYKTPIYLCSSCDIFYRDVDEARMVDHYYAASYIQSKNEQRFFNARIGFLRCMLSLVKRYTEAQFKDVHDPLSLVDFGCAYGHLLELAAEDGIRAAGIELNEGLVAFCRKKGLVVYKDLKELPEKVDAVTSIDSLYCVADCRALLADIKGCLKSGGVFIVRVTNRNLYTKLVGKYLHKGDLSTIGDAIVSYSARGINKLLALSGFEVIKMIPDHGKGKKLSFSKKLLYVAGKPLTLMTAKRVILTPGIIVVARVGTES